MPFHLQVKSTFDKRLVRLSLLADALAALDALARKKGKAAHTNPCCDTHTERSSSPAADAPATQRQLADAPAPSGADWRDTGTPVAERVRALLDQLSVDEKIGQLDATTHPTGAVERLGVPAFQGWNGALGQESSVVYWARNS